MVTIPDWDYFLSRQLCSGWNPYTGIGGKIWMLYCRCFAIFEPAEQYMKTMPSPLFVCFSPVRALPDYHCSLTGVPDIIPCCYPVSNALFVLGSIETSSLPPLFLVWVSGLENFEGRLYRRCLNRRKVLTAQNVWSWILLEKIHRWRHQGPLRGKPQRQWWHYIWYWAH